MRAFRLNVDQLEIFYKLCQHFDAQTEESRVLILDMMADLGQVDSITETSMSKDEYVKHIASKFGNVLSIKPKENQ